MSARRAGAVPVLMAILASTLSFFEALAYALAHFVVTSTRDDINNSLPMPVHAHRFVGIFRESRRMLDPHFMANLASELKSFREGSPMDPVGVVVSWVGLTFAGILVWTTVLQASRGALGPNSMLGIRTKTTMVSDLSWRRAHEAALPWTVRAIGAGMAVSIAGGLWLLIAGGGTSTSTKVLGSVFVLGGYLVFAAGLAIATSLANKAARRAGNASAGQQI